MWVVELESRGGRRAGFEHGCDFREGTGEGSHKAADLRGPGEDRNMTKLLLLMIILAVIAALPVLLKVFFGGKRVPQSFPFQSQDKLFSL